MVARAIWAACGREPEQPGEALSNKPVYPAAAVLSELHKAEMRDPWRSAVAHQANVIARSCDDGPDRAWKYELVDGDAPRTYAVRGDGKTPAAGHKVNSLAWPALEK